MKRFWGVLLTVIFLCTALCSPAAAFFDCEHGVSFTTPKGFFELTASNSHSNKDLLEKIGYSEKAFDNYLQKNGIIYFALNDDNTKQIIIMCRQTTFSQNLNNLSDLGEDGINTLAGEVLPKDYKDYEILRVGDTVYIQLATTSSDSGGNFYTFQYFTVKNGYLYSACFNYGGSYDQSAAELTEEYIKSLKIDSATASGGGGENIFFIILVIIIIAAAAFLIIRLAFSLTKDLRKVKKDGDEVKIHRRKY